MTEITLEKKLVSFLENYSHIDLACCLSADNQSLYICFMSNHTQDLWVAWSKAMDCAEELQDKQRKRKWIGLTDEMMAEGYEEMAETAGYRSAFLWAEDRLKELNNG